ncbi:EamA family transporter [Ereboglobus luteus]|nr:EamA family transporter [Ereboglobus luteus]
MSVSSAKSASTVALVAAFLTIYIVWGSTYLAMRVGVETMPPLSMAAVRFLVAGVIMFAFVKLRGSPRATARQWRDNALIAAFLLLGGNGLVIWAEQYIPSGITALLIGFSPMCMVLIEWAFPGGRRPGPYTIAGLVIGFAGIIVLVAPWEHFNDDGALPLKGVVAIIGSTVFWATGSILSRHVRNPAPAFSASAMQMLCGGAMLAVAAFVRGEPASIDIGSFSTRSWIALFYLIVIGSLVAFSTYTWLITHSTPARVSTYAYVNPIVAVFLGWLILDEPVTLRTLAAAAIIILSVMIIIVRKNKRAA